MATAAVGAPAFSTLLLRAERFDRQLDELHLDLLVGADFESMREQYTIADDVTYLNHASIGTVPRPVQEAHRDYLAICETNPWLYMWGGAWDAPREAVRGAVAAFLNSDAASIAITHNTTEAFNVLAHGLPLGHGDEVLYSTLNHSGASIAFEHVGEARGFTARRFEFPSLEVAGMASADVIDLYEKQITDDTRLLVLPHIDNTVGLRHPVMEIAAAARARGVDWVAVDGAQTAGMIDVDLDALGVDVFATSAHKWLQTPKGLGVTYYSQTVREVLRPMWVTWGQKWFKEAMRFEDYGTRNMPELLSLGDAIEFQSNVTVEKRTARLAALRDLAKELAHENPRTTWRSPERWPMGGSLFAIEISGAKSADLAKSMFAHHGFVFRPFEIDGVQTVRISPNVFTSEREIRRFFDLV